MTISFSDYHHCMLRRYMNQNHRNIFISLSDIDHYTLSFSTAFTPMLKTWESYTTKYIVRNNAILLKAQCKIMRHNDTIIFDYVHCASLSIFNVLTWPFVVM